jgi:feruloyl esterase
MSHCSGGQGPNSFDALTAIIKWVEQGTAPASLLTTQTPTSANPVQSLPAYPYPLMATYNGTGNVDVASSYHAALPAKPFNAHIHWLGTFSA